MYLTYLFVVVSSAYKYQEDKECKSDCEDGNNNKDVSLEICRNIGDKERETAPSRAMAIMSKTLSTTIEEMPSEYVVL